MKRENVQWTSIKADQMQQSGGCLSEKSQDRTVAQVGQSVQRGICLRWLHKDGGELGLTRAAVTLLVGKK